MSKDYHDQRLINRAKIMALVNLKGVHHVKILKPFDLFWNHHKRQCK